MPATLTQPTLFGGPTLAGFTEFCRAELTACGPDPQFSLLAALTATSSPAERVWAVGCYCAVHCFPTAVIMWHEWRADDALCRTEALQAWQLHHWKGLPVRPEMKSARMPAKRLACYMGFAKLAQTWPDLLATTQGLTPYDAVWSRAIASVPFFGRYMAIKFLELLRLTVAPDLVLADLRPRDAWSPRRVLGWLFPDEAHVLDSPDNSTATLGVVNAAGARTRASLATAGVAVTWYQLQVLLCEYREALAGGFYPGCSHDEELAYIRQAAAVFGAPAVAPIYAARRRLFPAALLGELNDWGAFRRTEAHAWRC